jgi:hypothetical protein
MTSAITYVIAGYWSLIVGQKFIALHNETLITNICCTASGMCESTTIFQTIYFEDDRLARNQDNVSKWSDMSIRSPLFLAL